VPALSSGGKWFAVCRAAVYTSLWPRVRVCD